MTESDVFYLGTFISVVGSSVGFGVCLLLEEASEVPLVIITFFLTRLECTCVPPPS